MNIVVVGLGLIGGSIAKSLSLVGEHCVLGADSAETVLEQACAIGAIAATVTDQGLKEADVIYLCLYPEAAVQWLQEKAPLVGKHTVVTDVCGIKTAICHRLQQIANTHGFCYLGSHPMAGKEQSGFAFSDGTLFSGASYIIASQQESPASALLRGLAVEMGFARVVNADPQEHDSMIAFTSQLPHVLACAYVMSPNCLKHQGFSAGSYRDVSRVAKINAPLWAELFLENKTPLLTELDGLMENLLTLRQAVAQEDKVALQSLLQRARERKELDEKG